MYEQLQEKKESNGNKTEPRFIQRRSQYFLELEALGCVCVCMCVCVMLGCGAGEASASRLDGWIWKIWKCYNVYIWDIINNTVTVFLIGTIDENGVLGDTFNN